MTGTLGLATVRALHEAFVCGTAAVVTPIDKKGREYSFTIGDGDDGPVAGRLRAALLDIEQERTPNRHG